MPLLIGIPTLNMFVFVEDGYFSFLQYEKKCATWIIFDSEVPLLEY